MVRDYDLTGPNNDSAVDHGLASAEWYHSDLPRKEMKALMARRDGPAIRDTILWIGLLVGFGATGALLYPSWWSVPFFLAYGVLYGSSGDSRWHECGHGTAFRTRWMNTVVYQIASFMMIRNPVIWRWSHARHHSDTIIVGRDPEIVAMRPPALFRMALNVFGVIDFWYGIKDMLRYASGRISASEADFVPESEHAKAIFVARVWTVIYAGTLVCAIVFSSWLPFLLIGGPRMYGCWHAVMTGILQHAGLAEDVLDHRLNSRTVYMNPISRFIYWNMNYHIEHHMFPMVPYHALPKLHEAIKHDLPPANPGIFHAYGEVIAALSRQRRSPRWFVKRELPPTAKPYRPEFHGDVEPAL